MKFLVFSDSHEYTNGLERAIEKHNDITHIIHCGDVSVDVEYLHHVYGTSHTICAVCGNNDYRCDDPLFRVFSCEGHKVYVTHGHKEHVKQTLHTVVRAAEEKSCDICIFGHTHTQFFEKRENLHLLNPGSIGYFRMEYAILNIENDNVEISLHKI